MNPYIWNYGEALYVTSNIWIFDISLYRSPCTRAQGLWLEEWIGSTLCSNYSTTSQWKGESWTNIAQKLSCPASTSTTKHYCVPFGTYCQVHEEDGPRNSLVTCTQGAISMGPSKNRQGGHIFFHTHNSKGCGAMVLDSHSNANHGN